MITPNKEHTHKHTQVQASTVERRDLYLETLNTEKKQTIMPPVGYEPAILVVNGSLNWIFWQ